jgi:uncharacterized protein (TIGR02996 family)
MKQNNCRIGSIALLIFVIAVGCSVPRGSLTPSLVKSRGWTQKGLFATEKGDWTEAEKMLGEAVKACPDDREARLHYADVLRQNGHTAESMKQLELLLLGSVEDGPIHLRIAQIRLELEQFDKASRHAEIGLALDPNSAEAWAMRARILAAANRKAESLTAYHRAVGLDPNRRDWLLAMAELYRRLNRPEEALLTLHSLADTYPLGETPQKVYYLQGLAYQTLGRADEAIEVYTIAQTQGPNEEVSSRLAELQKSDAATVLR